MSKTVSRSYHHWFRFLLRTTGSRTVEIRSRAKVHIPARPVELSLEPEHVEESLRRKGVADIHNCSMAICSTTHAEDFPHPFEGYIDWYYSRVYVASKLDGRGLPSECYCYKHSDDIAQYQDTLRGQRKLLLELKKNGPRRVTLFPVSLKQSGGVAKPYEQRKGRKTKRPKPRGPKLRHATAMEALQAAGVVAAK